MGDLNWERLAEALALCLLPCAARVGGLSVSGWMEEHRLDHCNVRLSVTTVARSPER